MGVPLVACLIVGAGCSSGRPEWADRNQRVIDEFKITGRTRDLPAVRATLFTPGQPVENATLPTAILAPGVVARLALGPRRSARAGGDAARRELSRADARRGTDRHRPGRRRPPSSSTARPSSWGKDQVLYLQPGAKRSVKAGPADGRRTKCTRLCGWITWRWRARRRRA